MLPLVVHQTYSRHVLFAHVCAVWMLAFPGGVGKTSSPTPMPGWVGPLRAAGEKKIYDLRYACIDAPR